MKVLINDKVSTFAECKDVMLNKIPKSIKMASYNDYEENIEWTDLTFEYDDNIVVIPEGYNGFWELISYDKMTNKNKTILNNDLVDWLSYQFDC